MLEIDPMWVPIKASILPSEGIIILKGQRDSTAGRVCALHMANPCSIPGIPPGVAEKQQQKIIKGAYRKLV